MEVKVAELMDIAQTTEKVRRNAPCPCGSGRKYKHCHGDPRQVHARTGALRFPITMPKTRRIYYLDTCVWGSIVASERATVGLADFCALEEAALAFSSFTLYELSRAPHKFPDWDNLLFKLREYVFLASIYDQVIEGELNVFPRPWTMKWLPLSLINDYQSPDFLQTLSDHQLFIQSREEFRDFGLTRFKSLEALKENFPPLFGPDYTMEDAPHFAWAAGIDFLTRQFAETIRPHWRYIRKRGHTSLDTLLSMKIRELVIFVKYYLHGHTVEDSDFFDFAQVSFAPYCDVFVTERNLANVLRRIKGKGYMLENTAVVHVTDFVRTMEKYGVA